MIDFYCSGGNFENHCPFNFNLHGVVYRVFQNILDGYAKYWVIPVTAKTVDCRQQSTTSTKYCCSLLRESVTLPRKLHVCVRMTLIKLIRVIFENYSI